MNKYLETGTVFRKGDMSDVNGNDVTHIMRKVIASHQRSLQGPHGLMAGKRMTTLGDGTVITTWVNPYGLAPTLIAHVYTPNRMPPIEEIEISLESGLMFANDVVDVEGIDRPRLWVSLEGLQPLTAQNLIIYNKAFPPEAFANGYYTSQLWGVASNPMYNDDPVFDPLEDEYDGTYSCASMYTGLLRAGIEAKLGLGAGDASWADRYRYFSLLPWGAGPPFLGTEVSYKHDGLVRTTDYTYFVVRITATECKACELVVVPGWEETATLVRDLLCNPSLSTLDSDKLESVYLSLLQYKTSEGSPVEIALLDEEDLTPTFDPPIQAAIAYGWHFAYPPLQEASIIRQAYTWVDAKKTARAYLTTVTFTTTQNEDRSWEISASAATTDKGVWTPSTEYLPIWVPKPFHFPWLLNMARDTDWAPWTDLGEPVAASIYCFYHKTKGLQLCTASLAQGAPENDEEVHTPTHEQRISVCDAYGSVRSIIPFPYTYSTTVSLSVGDIAETKTVMQGQALQYDQTISTSFAEQYIDELGAGIETIKQECVNGDGVINETGWMPNPFKIYMDVGSASYNLTKTNLVPAYYPLPGDTARQDVCVSLVIPRLNAEAVGMFYRKVEREVRASVYDAMSDKFYSSARYEFYADATFTTIVGGIERYYGYSCGAAKADYTNFLFTGSRIGMPGLTPLVNQYTNGIIPGTLTESTIDIEPLEESARLITSSQTIDLAGSGDPWYVYLSPDTWATSDTIDFQAMESRLGNIIYPRHSDTGDWILKYSYAPGTVDFVPGESTTISLFRGRWIGWD